MWPIFKSKDFQILLSVTVHMVEGHQDPRYIRYMHFMNSYILKRYIYIYFVKHRSNEIFVGKMFLTIERKIKMRFGNSIFPIIIPGIILWLFDTRYFLQIIIFGIKL